MSLKGGLACALGFHKYMGSTAKFTHITGNTFRVENQCVRCGKQDYWMAEIPLPKQEAAGAEKAARMFASAYSMEAWDGAVFIEYNPERCNQAAEWALLDCISDETAWLATRDGEDMQLDVGRYGMDWRCWTGRPAPGQRAETEWIKEDVPWDESTV